MDESMNTNQITLEYLMNPELYNKYKKGKVEIDNELSNDIEFYKERILNETNKMINGDIDIVLTEVFENYCRELINNFKFQDKRDLYQEEYCDISNNINKNIDNNKDDDNYNELLVKKKPLTMKKFINIKDTHKVFLPQEKEVNLRDNKYKTKGINNIDSMYEQKTKNKEERPKKEKDQKGRKKTNIKIEI